MPTLLIVSGSRTCADDPQKELWVQTELLTAMRFLGPKDAVLSGSSPGRKRIVNGKAREEAPDIWAREAAIAKGVPVSEFRLDGFRWINGQRTERRWEDLANAGGGRGLSTPLARNIAMCEAGRRAMLQGWDVVLVGFIDPTSATFGTGHTCKNAKRLCVPTCDLVYPMLIEDHIGPDPSNPRPGYFSPLPDLLFLDTETSARDPRHGMMIEFAAVRCHPKTLAEKLSFETKIALEPWALVESRALEINGYTPERWAGAPRLHDALNKMLDAGLFDGEPRIAAYNAQYDRKVTESAFARCGAEMPKTYRPDLCVFAEAKKLRDGGRYRLDDVCDRYGISNQGHHEAMTDVRRMIAALPRIREDLARPRPAATAVVI